MVFHATVCAPCGRHNRTQPVCEEGGGRSDRRDARSRLGIDADAVVFLLFGRLHAYKGVIELLEAFSQIQHQAVLILPGPPADKQTEDLIESKCAALSSVIKSSVCLSAGGPAR